MAARYSMGATIGHVPHHNRQQSHVRALRMLRHAQMEREHEYILSITSPSLSAHAPVRPPHVLARVLQESVDSSRMDERMTWQRADAPSTLLNLCMGVSRDVTWQVIGQLFF